MSQLTLEDIRRDCCQELYVQCAGFTEPHGVITVFHTSPDGLPANWYPVPAWCPLCCFYIDANGDQQTTQYYLYFLDNSGNEISLGGVDYMVGVCDGHGTWWFYKPGYGQDGCIVVGSTGFVFEMSVAGGYGGGYGDTSYGALVMNAFYSYGTWYNFWNFCDYWWWGTAIELHGWRITDYKCNDQDGFSCTWRIPDGGQNYQEGDGYLFLSAGVRYFKVAAAAPTINTSCRTIKINGCGNYAPLPGAVYDIYNQHYDQVSQSYSWTLLAEGTTDYSGYVVWDQSVGNGYPPLGSGAPPDRLYRTINHPSNRFKPQIVSGSPQYPYSGYYTQLPEYLNQPADGYVCNSSSYFQLTPFPLAQYMNWTIYDVGNQRVLWSSDDYGPLFSQYGYGWKAEFDYLFQGCPGTGCPDPTLVHVVMVMNPGQYPYGSFYIQFQGVRSYNWCPDPTMGAAYGWLIFDQAVSTTAGLPFLMQAMTSDMTQYGGIGMFCSNGPLLFTATEVI